MHVYKIKIHDPAFRQLQKLPPDTQRRIMKKLEYFAASDSPLSFAEHLTNFQLGQYRFRVGDYRIIIDVMEDSIVVLAIGHRREIYR